MTTLTVRTEMLRQHLHPNVKLETEAARPVDGGPSTRIVIRFCEFMAESVETNVFIEAAPPLCDSWVA